VSEEQRGVILYGRGRDAVAEALRELDPRYVLVDPAAQQPGQVPVRCCRDAAEADAARQAVSGVAWLVVELYQPGVNIAHARAPVLSLNSTEVDPGLAARAIDQSDLVTWYEVIHPARVITVDGQPPADDYSNIEIVVPGGHRMVAHAVRAEETPPECLPGAALQILPSDDLWALARLRGFEVCRACTLRHG